ncbi:MAG: class I poly(R)-hydroxyalkanoic acid synthase, partial [Halomonas sp.]|nr:class I poly(R)-hydroxyalkanoic acid synthase [Halomonas sp.]
MQSGDAVFSQVELEEWKEQLQEMGQHYQGLLQDLLERMAPDAAADSIQADMRDAFQAGAESLMRNPQLLWQ